MRRNIWSDALVVALSLVAGLGLLVIVNPEADASRLVPPMLSPEAHPEGESLEELVEDPGDAAPRNHIRHLARPIVRSDKPPVFLARTDLESDSFYRMPCDNCQIMSGFHDRRRRGRHRALDLNSDSPDFGLGDPVFAIGRSVVTLVGEASEEPHQFGRPLEREGTVRRGGRNLPTFEDVEGYGRVYYFTRTYGSWRAGTTVVTELLDGPLAGHEVRYMHLGAVHPAVREGAIVARGQEIALLGGSAIMSDAPHLHIDSSSRGGHGNRINLSPWVGLSDDDRLRARYETEIAVLTTLPDLKSNEMRAKGLLAK